MQGGGLIPVYNVFQYNKYEPKRPVGLKYKKFSKIEKKHIYIADIIDRIVILLSSFYRRKTDDIFNLETNYLNHITNIIFFENYVCAINERSVIIFQIEKNIRSYHKNTFVVQNNNTYLSILSSMTYEYLFDLCFLNKESWDINLNIKKIYTQIIYTYSKESGSIRHITHFDISKACGCDQCKSIIKQLARPGFTLVPGLFYDEEEDIQPKDVYPYVPPGAVKTTGGYLFQSMGMQQQFYPQSFQPLPPLQPLKPIQPPTSSINLDFKPFTFSVSTFKEKMNSEFNSADIINDIKNVIQPISSGESSEPSPVAANGEVVNTYEESRRDETYEDTLSYEDTLAYDDTVSYDEEAVAYGDLGTTSDSYFGIENDESMPGLIYNTDTNKDTEQEEYDMTLESLQRAFSTILYGSTGDADHTSEADHIAPDPSSSGELPSGLEPDP